MDTESTAGHPFDPRPPAVRWELLHENRTIWPAVFHLCEAARHSISIEQYIFSEEGVGRRLIDLLAHKQRQGVRVRLLVDGYASGALPGSEGGAALRKADGEILLYNPLSDLLLTPIRGLHRLHRKSVLCDGKAMMVGGSCFDERMADWRDTMIRLEGEPARAAHLAFETIWDHTWARTREPQGLEKRLHEDPPGGWDYMTSEPVRPTRQDIYKGLLRRLEGAARSVTLWTPYFVPDRRFWSALSRLPARGVRLRLLVPARSDQRPVDVSTHFFARRLAARGAEVHAYEPSMTHAKLAIVDDAWAMVSSFNLDILSFGINVENGLASTDPALVAALNDQFERDAAESSRF